MHKQLPTIILVIVLLVAAGALVYLFKEGAGVGRATYMECVQICGGTMNTECIAKCITQQGGGTAVQPGSSPSPTPSPTPSPAPRGGGSLVIPTPSPWSASSSAGAGGGGTDTVMYDGPPCTTIYQQVLERLDRLDEKKLKRFLIEDPEFTERLQHAIDAKKCLVTESIKIPCEDPDIFSLLGEVTNIDKGKIKTAVGVAALAGGAKVPIPFESLFGASAPEDCSVILKHGAFDGEWFVGIQIGGDARPPEWYEYLKEGKKFSEGR